MVYAHIYWIGSCQAPVSADRSSRHFSAIYEGRERIALIHVSPVRALSQKFVLCVCMQMCVCICVCTCICTWIDMCISAYELVQVSTHTSVHMSMCARGGTQVNCPVHVLGAGRTTGAGST